MSILKLSVSRLSHRLNSLPLSVRMMGLVMGLVLTLGLAVTLSVRARLARDLGLGLQERGIAITRDLASRAADLALTENTFALYQLARDTVENNPDVRYVFLLDTDGQPIVHSFPASVPPDLLAVNQPAADAPYRLQSLESDEGRLLDVAVPMLNGRAGVVRVGLSLQRLNQAIAQATLELSLITLAALLGGAGLTFFAARRLTRPLLELVQMSRLMSAGNWQVRARPAAQDEIGVLGHSFNQMADSLAETHTKLLRRAQELASLNAIANAASSALGVQEVLQAALDKILETLHLQAGCFFLVDEKAPFDLRLAAQRGVSETFAAQEVCRPFQRCVCAHVLKSGQAVMMDDLRLECRRLAPETLQMEDLAGYVSVPLLARERVLGVLNLVSHEKRTFTPQDLALLDSIGRQLGVAIENARLWEQVKEKEALRGQLLEKVIAAQEAERQRLARELHDEAAQTLTALSLGLRSLQEAPGLPPAQKQLAESLKEQTLQLMAELHRLSVELRPSALDRVGLAEALRQYANEFGERYPLRIEFEAEGLEGAVLQPEAEISLYRIVQEALTNVARHAQASHVSVTMQRRGGSIVTVIEDDGKGFDPQQAAKTGRLGLFGMQERAALAGGSLRIESAPGSGTTIYVEIPLLTQKQTEQDVTLEPHQNFAGR